MVAGKSMKLFSFPFRAIIPSFLAALILALAFAQTAGAAVPEKTRVVLSVGGKTTLYCLPLILADRLGYFRDEGLDVEIDDFPGGSRALQALIGHSADVVSGVEPVMTLLERSGDMKIVVETITKKGVDNSYKVLLAHNPAVRRAPMVWINQTYTNAFVEKALQKYR
jgi:ABC-type nitrate/sulfonate/bicarbonate transport system substrate-binding protein